MFMTLIHAKQWHPGLLSITLMFTLLFSGNLFAQEEATILKKQIQSINLNDYIQSFAIAPQEDQLVGEKSNVQVSILMPNGQLQAFRVVKNDLMDPAFEAAFPEIGSYTLVSVDNEQVIGRSTLSPYGFMATIFSEQGLVSVRPLDMKNPVEHEVTLERGINTHFSCGVTEEIKAEPQLFFQKTIITNGDQLRTYNLAIVTTGEFAQTYGGTEASASAAVTQAVAAVELIYERDLAVNFNLLPPAIYLNPSTDPFSGSDRISLAVNTVATNFPNSGDYDIGHALHSSGNGWGGGIAGLSALCSDNPSGNGVRKAAGWTSLGNNLANGGGIGVFAHELGHMFGMPHTWNGQGGGCSLSNHSSGSAYEIGSGSTIMSYQGLCSSNQNIPNDQVVYPGNNDGQYFHVNGLELAVNLMNARSCGVSTPTGNFPPDIDANPCGQASYTIPIGTPFRLRGEGSDFNGDVLYYSWEQYDEDGAGEPTYGLIGSQAASNPLAPLFRSLPYVTSPERFFPSMDLILNEDFESSFEPLPTVARDMTFRLTARDLRPGGGAIEVDEVRFTVAPEGPFNVTAPLNGTAVETGPGNPTTITWDVNGTDAFCTNVKLLISVDGGQTYNIELLSSTANDGSEDVIFPNTLPNASDCKLMVACADNDCVMFFDVSPGFFSVNTNCFVEENHICPVNALNLPPGDVGLDLNESMYIGDALASYTFSTSPGGPVARVANATTQNGGFVMKLMPLNSLMF